MQTLRINDRTKKWNFHCKTSVVIHSYFEIRSDSKQTQSHDVLLMVDFITIS